MAILCRAAKNSLRGTLTYLMLETITVSRFRTAKKDFPLYKFGPKTNKKGLYNPQKSSLWNLCLFDYFTRLEIGQ
jgi:hypothetical protein